MAKKPYKFRQARKDAKTAAKKAFPGKVKAVRKDITGKITAEDRLALKDMADTAKRELGKKAYLSKADYEAEQRAAREKFREQMRQEFGEYGGKKATPEEVATKKAPVKKASLKEVAANTKKYAPKGSKTVIDTPVTKGGELEKKLITDKKAAAKKAPVKKAAIKSTKTFGEISKAVTDKTKAPAKGMTRAEKSAANKAAWKNMSPAERKNWQANKPGAKKIVITKADTEKVKASKAPTNEVKLTPEGAEVKKRMPGMNNASANDLGKRVVKPAPTTKAAKAPSTTPKRPTLTDLKKNEAKGLEEAKARVAAKNKALANSAKGKTQTPQATKAKAKAAAKPEGKVAKPKFRKIKGAGKAGAIGALAGEVVSGVKGSTTKDLKEIVRLKNKLEGITGEKKKGLLRTFAEGAGLEAGQLASLATMGIVGKTRRQRMDELNALIAKAEAKKAKENKGLRYGPGGESLVPGTDAYKKGSTTRPKVSTGAGGATTQTTSSSKYTVKKGDTLWGIAKANNTTLAELRKANPDIMKKKKYKQGSMIWSGTQVNIPKK